MVSVVLFFLLICSGSVFASAFWGKRFEEVLPVTCALIVLVLYVCGLLGALALGAALVCVLAGCAYMAAGIKLWRTRGWKKFTSVYITPPPFLFLLLFVYLTYACFGLLANNWDEFSHWMDTVKILSTLDAFGFSPQAHALFPAYPPGMSLFQYMLQKLSQWTGGPLMTEWMAYLAYQTLFFSFLWPFTKVLDGKKPLVLLFSCALVYLAPMVFYGDIYHCIYIDPILGILSGAGLATVFLQNEHDTLSSLRVFAACFLLVLAKDVGLLLAVFLACAYILTLWTCSGRKDTSSLSVRRKLLCSAAAAAAVIFPRFTWTYALRAAGRKISFASYTPGLLFDLLTGRGTPYQTEIWDLFFQKLFTGKDYREYMVLLAVFLLLLSCLLVRKKLVSGKRAAIVVTLVFLQTAVYIVGLAMTYITRFSEYEARRLASFSRYMGIGFSAVLILIVLLAVCLLPKLRFRRTAAAVMLAFMITFIPYLDVYRQMRRIPVYHAQDFRSQYVPLAGKIQEALPEDAVIWLVDQGSSGLNYFVLRSVARPRYIANSSRWSIGEPFYEGDIWTAVISAERWREILLESYDAVAIFHLNDYFIDNYACLFADPADMAENAVYRVNKDTGLLELCTP